ncbi:hypothetical protein BDA99DRAFT_494973 [Phascolomyces articulosus]|uniref:Uncharacterized protein n=1 Tax=Phascolomyces articulosus TaxID=60185 RepID=A0AAD5PJT2_9FUNG|nr:hypothetical protein BDA99DRAFT_494973 [Phascolomyces articulosus]
MSATTTITTTAIEQPVPTTTARGGGYYKSFLKPGKFWQRNTNKVSSSSHEQEEQRQKPSSMDENPVKEEHPQQQQQQQQHTKKASFISMPTSPFKSTKPDPHQSPALREAAKTEVYKLSTVNDSGVFLPPSPKLDSKRDHWIELDEEAMIFRLPSPKCLTTYGKDNHHKALSTLYTPSATVFPRSSSVDTTNEDDVPSLITDLSSGQSSS